MIDEVVDWVIDGRRLVTHLQPIVSIKGNRVVGYEALSRGICPGGGSPIGPAGLFESARRRGRVLELDRACRQRALERWVSYPSRDECILFMNFDTSVLADTVPGSGWMARLVRDLGLDPRRIAVEIVESRVPQFERLAEFVRMYRDIGFLVVLDDFGAEYSNLDRMVHIHPDIIKIDRSLVDGVGADYYKRSIVGSIIELAGRIGALTLAEGVENLEDIIACYELGADLFQGYYFSPPTGAPDPGGLPAKRVRLASESIARYLEMSLAERMLVQKAQDSVIAGLLESLAGMDLPRFDPFLADQVTAHTNLECAYILDTAGRQVTETAVKRGAAMRPGNPLFSPAVRGDDHSLKSYYSSLRGLSLRRYVTNPYISMASGNICRTFAATFTARAGMPYILCVDFLV